MANKKIEFELIVEDILNNDKFKSLSLESHHGITRYDHSLRVAKLTYKIMKLLNNDNYINVVRGALLHDFYNNSDLDKFNRREKLGMHPNVALINAKEYFEIDSVQEDIIKNHMFPLTTTLPKSKSGILVSLVDKGVATYEMLHFKVSMQLSYIFILLINIISINN